MSRGKDLWSNTQVSLDCTLHTNKHNIYVLHAVNINNQTNKYKKIGTMSGT